MKSYKVILWGSRTEYDYYRKWFEVEILKSNIQMLGIIFNEGMIFKRIDGIDVVGIEVLRYMEYDYIVDMNQNAHAKVLRILELLKIPLDKVVPARIFSQPFFDFVRWVQVKERNVSIMSSHCWGGYAYNTLGLKFGTPLINMFFDNEDFFRLLTNLEGYMYQPLVKIGEEYEMNLKRNYPVVKLGDVVIHFNHYTDFDDAIETWNRRKTRINYNNIFVEMTAKTKEDIDRFLQLPYEHKICYTMIPCNEKNVISIKAPYFREMYADNEWQYALGTAMQSYAESKQCDLLKLLNNEPDYLRAEFDE